MSRLTALALRSTRLFQLLSFLLFPLLCPACCLIEEQSVFIFNILFNYSVFSSLLLLLVHCKRLRACCYSLLVNPLTSVVLRSLALPSPTMSSSFESQSQADDDIKTQVGSQGPHVHRAVDDIDSRSVSTSAYRMPSTIPLNPSDFLGWSVMMEAMLVHAGLWDFVRPLTEQ